jgi:hypothetical protein
MVSRATLRCATTASSDRRTESMPISDNKQQSTSAFLSLQIDSKRRVILVGRGQGSAPPWSRLVGDRWPGRESDTARLKAACRPGRATGAEPHWHTAGFGRRHTAQAWGFQSLEPWPKLRLFGGNVQTQIGFLRDEKKLKRCSRMFTCQPVSATSSNPMICEILTFPLPNFGFNTENSVRRLRLKSNCLPSQHLHKDLHCDGDKRRGKRWNTIT